jgi:hypothetical protein
VKAIKQHEKERIELAHFALGTCEKERSYELEQAKTWFVQQLEGDKYVSKTEQAVAVETDGHLIKYSHLTEESLEFLRREFVERFGFDFIEKGMCNGDKSELLKFCKKRLKQNEPHRVRTKFKDVTDKRILVGHLHVAETYFVQQCEKPYHHPAVKADPTDRMVKYSDVTGGERAKRFLKNELDLRGICSVWVTRSMNLGQLLDELKKNEMKQVEELHKEKEQAVLDGYKSLARTHFLQWTTGALYTPKKTTSTVTNTVKKTKRKAGSSGGNGKGKKGRCRY